MVLPFPPPFSTVLAVESSTDTLSLALQAGGQCWLRERQGGAQASSQILQEIQALMAEAQLPLDALDLLVCGRGPGAFTGVRVAVAVVQGLAAVRDLPVFPVSGLLAVAEAARMQVEEGCAPCKILATQDARMGQIYAALCAWDGQSWSLGDEGLCDYAALSVPAGAQLAGNIAAAYAEAGFPLPAPCLECAPSAEHLLRVAQQMLARGDAPLLDPAHLLPVYVRNKVAQTTAERMALRANS